MLIPSILLFIYAAIPALAAPSTTNISTEIDSSLLTETDLPISEQPEVILQSLDITGKSQPGVGVAIRDLSDTKTVVYRGVTDEFGQLKFKSNVSNDFINKSTRNVVDAVYEAYFISPDGDLVRTVFSVPHVKDRSKLDQKELKLLEKNRDKNVVVKQAKTANQILAQDIETTSPASTSASNCEILVDGYEKCLVESHTYSVPTKVASINVASGEKVDFNLTSSAKVNLQAGYKKDSNPFSYSGSVSLSTDTSTSVDYSFGGSCMYYGSSYSCNLARNVYAQYTFLYENYQMMRYGTLQWTEVDVTPTGLAGGSPQADYSYSDNNGRSASSVINNSYGANFAVYNNSSAGSSSTTKSYTTEKTYSGAFSVATPVGTFSGGVTTAYKNSHSIKWYVPSVSSTTFYHYDYGTSGQDWYVTY